MAAAFSVLLLGMAGFPLTSGFVAKFGVFANAWAAGFQWLVVLAVFASVMALAVYLRVIVTMYMDDAEGEGFEIPPPARWALVIATAATILWGILPGSLLDLVANAFPI